MLAALLAPTSIAAVLFVGLGAPLPPIIAGTGIGFGILVLAWMAGRSMAVRP